MTEAELVVGKTYFQIVYPDSSLTRPIVITYEFLSIGKMDGSSEPAYLFKYFPAFTYSDDEERDQADSAPVAFTQEHIPDIFTLENLLDELKQVAGRVLSRAAP